MAGEVINKRVYQTNIHAHDTQSGKPILNTVYHMASTAAVGQGLPIVNSSVATFVAALQAQWDLFIVPRISVHYETQSYVCRGIVGWKWPTAQHAVIGSTPSLNFTAITTGDPHNFLDGMSVAITGTAGVTGLNAVFSPITVTGATSFTIPVQLPGALTQNGLVQRVFGDRVFEYADHFELVQVTAGGRPGEALPLYCTASVRRLNLGLGKHFRSHLALGPLPESDVQDGRFETASYTTFATACQGLNNALTNGNPGQMFPMVVSKALALLQPSPFGDPGVWAVNVTDHVPRRNMGTALSRKLRLDFPIT